MSIHSWASLHMFFILYIYEYPFLSLTLHLLYIYERVVSFLYCWTLQPQLIIPSSRYFHSVSATHL